MSANRCDRLVAPVSEILCRRAGRLAPVVALLLAAPSLHAQFTSTYGSGSYPQAYAVPNGVYSGTSPAPGPTVQQAQNVYYGNYQNNTVPGYIYPRNYYVPTPPSYGGDGITYYYVQNPNAPSYSRYSSPYAGARRSRPQSQTTTYPAPVTAPPVQPAVAPIQDDLGDGQKPVVSFHRPVNETFWFKADYATSSIRPMRVPVPLVTTASPLDFPQGAIGQPTTVVLFGNNSVGFSMFSGIRAEVGLFLDPDNRFSLDMCGFLLLPNSQSFGISADPNGNPVISRPIFDVTTRTQGAVLNSLPGAISGSVSIDTKAEMGGIELNARYHSYIRERVHVSSLLGFRYVRLAERMRIAEQINPLTNNFVTFMGNNVNGPFVNAPDFLRDNDEFRTVNQFFGPQIGSRVSWENSWCTLEGFAKLGVGASQQQATINGTTTLVSANGNQTAQGGILALPSNIGSHNRTIFGLVPELGFNLGVELTPRVRLNLGYSFLMWNHVIRPAYQIDRNVNPSQIPGSPTFGAVGGPSSPGFRFNDEFFWTHTFNLGVEIHY